MQLDGESQPSVTMDDEKQLQVNAG